MRKLLLIIFQFFLFSLFINLAYSQNNEINYNSVELIQSIEFIEYNKDLSFNKIKELPTGTFKTYKNEKLSKDSVYWVKIILLSNKIINEDYYIHFNNNISHIELFQPLDSLNILHKISGVFVSMNNRSDKGYLKDKLLFKMSKGKKNVLYLKVVNQLANNYTLSDIKLISKEKYSKNNINRNFIQGCFFGMLLILCLINFFLFIISHNKIYLLYSLYLFFTALFFFYIYQFSEIYFFQNYPQIDLFLFWSVFIAQYVYLLFFIELLKDENVPVWRKYVRYYSWFILTFLITILLISQINFRLATVISDFYTFTNIVFVISSLFIFYKKVRRTLKLVLTGSAIMVIGAFVTTYMDTDISLDNLIYYQLGLIVEVILYTLAVNYTYNQEHIEKINILYEKSILELEKNKKEQENKMLIEEVNNKNRILANKALIITEKENLIEEIIKQLKELKNNDKNKIQRIINSLKISLKNNSWEEFEMYFNEVHPKFYSTLNTKHPKLTPNERKLCAFIKLNLSSKEISAVTGRSLNTIDVSRSRLRKKMKLNIGENLNSFISNINCFS